MTSAPRPPTAHIVQPAVESACSFALQRIHGADLSSIGVTSTLRREGRSTVAAAAALVQRYEYRRKVLLVELDLDASSIAKTMGLNEEPGIADYLRGHAWIGECVQWYDDGLGVIVAGGAGADDPPLAAQIPSSSLVADLSELADVVVADLPPLPPVGYGAHLAPLFSTTLMVIRAGATPVPQIERAVASLDRAPYVILNAVSNPAPRWLRPFVDK
jgi:Mrp family chromosome partitioning ATPase